jgi:hypothetical protein
MPLQVAVPANAREVDHAIRSWRRGLFGLSETANPSYKTITSFYLKIFTIINASWSELFTLRARGHIELNLIEISLIRWLIQ